MLNLIWHLTYMCVLVFAMGYALHFYAYKRGIADEYDVVKTKALKKDAQGNERDYKTGNGFLDKWLDFGGGYYGIIAFIQLIFIEVKQLQDFIADWQGLNEFVNGLGLGTLIQLLVEQIMNFVQAIGWPADYIARFSIAEIAIFIAMTFVAYKLSQMAARRQLALNSDAAL